MLKILETQKVELTMKNWEIHIKILFKLYKVMKIHLIWLIHWNQAYHRNRIWIKITLIEIYYLMLLIKLKLTITKEFS
jgi:hypothetical protein